MRKGMLMTALAAAVALGMGYGNQSKSSSTVKIQVQRTAAANGKAMYVNYCAPCHGVTGKGNGPVAVALKQQPIDLTVLSRNNGGKYPATHVLSVLEYGSEIPSHGTAQMPVWGPILGSMDQSDPINTRLRISNLTHFIETIQVK
jgi:mono/diheme cytochrome c family protein